MDLCRPMTGVLALGALLLTGCADVGASGAAEADPPAAQDLLLSVEQVPEGFAEDGGENPQYRTTVCGVPVETVDPVDTASARFSLGPVGPFLEQRVRVYAEADGTAAVAALREALAGCESYTTEDGGTQVAVSPLEAGEHGDDAVALRLEPQGDLQAVNDVLLVRYGTAVVMLSALAIDGEEPDPGWLQDAADALDRTAGQVPGR